MDSGTGRRQLRQLDALLHVTRRAPACSAAATSTRSRIYDRALLPRPRSPSTMRASARTGGRSHAFTIAPNPAKPGQTVTFNGSSSSDPDGTIVKYEWDLDGNGTLRDQHRHNADASRTDPTTHRATVAVAAARHRQPDGHRHGDHARCSSATRPPTASFTATPNPALVDQTVDLQRVRLERPDGTIVKYEWDLDGNGSYETDTGTTRDDDQDLHRAGHRQRSACASPTTAATTARRSRPRHGRSARRVELPATRCSDTPGLVNYWRHGRGGRARPSPTARARAPATAATGVTFGVGRRRRRTTRTPPSRFDGPTTRPARRSTSRARATLTVEFWLKWNAYANDDASRWSSRRTSTSSAGGFLVDPNAPQFGGTFGVGDRRAAPRATTSSSPRPTAGAWHHYALVLRHHRARRDADHAVRRRPARHLPEARQRHGRGQLRQLDAVLHVARRQRALRRRRPRRGRRSTTGRSSAATIAEHFGSSGTNRRPMARAHAVANPVQPEPERRPSERPGRRIPTVRSSSTSGTSTATAATRPTRARPTPSRARTRRAGDRVISLRVMDNRGGTRHGLEDALRRQRHSHGELHDQPEPGNHRQTVTFNASASSDPDGTITKYEWDLDGNGTFETDTGTTATTSRVYANAATVNIGLRVTDDDGATGTTTRAFSVKSASYQNAVLATPGLKNYWRMDELPVRRSRTPRARAPRPPPGRAFGGPGALPGAGNAAGRFDGITGSAAANIDLSASTAVTVEFWLKWDVYATTTTLAMEFTSNFNQNDGGFLIDPNSADGAFAVGIGRDSRGTTSPSRGRARTSGTTTSSCSTPPRRPPPRSRRTWTASPWRTPRLESGTGAPAFANSTLYFHVARRREPLRCRRSRRGGDLRRRAERSDRRRALRRRYAVGRSWAALVRH